MPADGRQGLQLPSEEACEDQYEEEAAEERGQDEGEMDLHRTRASCSVAVAYRGGHWLRSCRPDDRDSHEYVSHISLIAPRTSLSFSIYEFCRADPSFLRKRRHCNTKFRSRVHSSRERLHPFAMTPSVHPPGRVLGVACS